MKKVVEKAVMESSVLLIVFDVNPSQKYLQQNPQHFSAVLESVITTGSCHLMKNPSNKLYIFGCHHASFDVLYPMPGMQMDVRQTDAKMEALSLVERTVKERLAHFLNNLQWPTSSVESHIASSMVIALCYINRLKLEASPRTKLEAHILVVTGSIEHTTHYMTYMNAFFSAQKMDIIVDCCALVKEQNLMKQGCDITGGRYLCVKNLPGLLEYLLWVFMPSKNLRKKFNLPDTTKVDYRASCFCHRELVEIGYVCSVCMSVFCKFTPLCTTCNARFSSPLLPKIEKNNNK